MKVVDDYFDRLIGHALDDCIVSAYVSGTFKQYAMGRFAVVRANECLTTYVDATNTLDFVKLQDVADWLLWLGTFATGEFDKRSVTYTSVARSSYDACDRMLGRKLPVMGELSREFSNIVASLRRIDWCHDVTIDGRM